MQSNYPPTEKKKKKNTFDEGLLPKYTLKTTKGNKCLIKKQAEDLNKHLIKEDKHMPINI